MTSNPHIWQRAFSIAVVLLICCSDKVDASHSRRVNSKSKSKNDKQGILPSRNSFQYLLWDEDVSTLPRKPLDQFKWPWRNYEEWKKGQEKAEKEIDTILKFGGYGKRGKITLSKGNKRHRQKSKHSWAKNRRNATKIRMSDSKKGKNKARKLLANDLQQKSTNQRVAMMTEPQSLMGGAVLSVKYYSTEERDLNVKTNVPIDKDIALNDNSTIQNERHGTTSELIGTEATVLSESIPEKRIASNSGDPSDFIGTVNSTLAVFPGAEIDMDRWCIPEGLTGQFNGTHICINVESDLHPLSEKINSNSLGSFCKRRKVNQ